MNDSTGDLWDLPPFQRHSDTSRDAAVDMAGSRADTERARVLQYIKDCGERGATDDEVQVALQMIGSTQRPRRVELYERGLVLDTGTRRKTRTNHKAAVWRATDIAPTPDTAQGSLKCPVCERRPAAGRGEELRAAAARYRALTAIVESLAEATTAADVYDLQQTARELLKAPHHFHRARSSNG